MHSHVTRLNDPKFASNRAARGERKEISQATAKKVQRGGAAEFQDDDASGPFGWEPRNLCEITIQGNESASLSEADLKDDFIRGAGKAFLTNRHGIVTSSSQQINSSSSDILVYLDPHSEGSSGSGITRSREASAP